MPVVSANGQQIDYQIFGEGEPLIFISGMTMSQIPWTIYQKDYFMNQGFMVVVYDNRDVGSSGDSTSVNYTVSDMAVDLNCLMDEIDIEEAHIVGYSLGGMIGLELALQAPEKLKTLSLLGTTACQLEAERNLLEVVKSVKSSLSATDFWRFMGNKVMSWRFFENKDAVEKWFAFVTSEMNEQSVEALHRQANACKDFDVSDQLADISIPTHVLVGLEDTMLPPHHSRAISESIPNSRLTEIADVAHAAYSESAEIFNEAVLSFIRSNR